MHRGRGALALLAVAFVGLVGLACTDPRPQTADGAVTIAKETQASWVRNFNPLIAPSLSRWPSTCGIYEPLMVWNVMADAYVPWLATGSRFSEDGRTLTFTLREGVTWSDGQAFTAEDVVFTFELLRAHPALDLHAVWGFLAGVRAVGGHTVVFALRRPFVPGLADLAQQPIVPAHVWRHVEDPVTFQNEDPVATGPFTEVRLFRDQVFVLGKNPHYWQPGLPKVDALRFPAYSSNEQANLALVADEVDWAGNFVPAIERIFVAKDPEHHHYWFPPVGNMVMLYANTEHPVLARRGVRKALSRAIDRERLVEIAMYGYTEPADATGLGGTYASWKDPELAAAGDWTTHDPERAERELDALGLVRGPDGRRRKPDGAPLRLRLSVITGWSDWVRAAQVVAQALRAVGVDVVVTPRDFSAWFDAMQRGDFDLAVGWTVPGPTPYIYYRELMASGANWQRFSAPETEAVFDAFERAQDRETQQALARALQQAFVQHAPALPLFQNPPWGAYNTRRFVGFPSAGDPYAKLTPNDYTQPLLVLVRLQPAP